eukprot:3575541-Heterocapsa_arctica.AAC.2
MIARLQTAKDACVPALLRGMGSRVRALAVAVWQHGENKHSRCLQTGSWRTLLAMRCRTGVPPLHVPRIAKGTSSVHCFDALSVDFALSAQVISNARGTCNKLSPPAYVARGVAWALPPCRQRAARG